MEMSNLSGKKVKILVSTDEYVLEKQINDFIQKSKCPVWNIQYQCEGSPTIGGTRYSALLIYG